MDEQEFLRQRTFQAELWQVQSHEKPSPVESSVWSSVAGPEGGRQEVFYVPLMQPRNKIQDTFRSLVPGAIQEHRALLPLHGNIAHTAGLEGEPTPPLTERRLDERSQLGEVSWRTDMILGPKNL